MNGVVDVPHIPLGPRTSAAMRNISFRYGTVRVQVANGSPAWPNPLVRELEAAGWRHRPGAGDTGLSAWWRGMTFEEHALVLTHVLGTFSHLTATSHSVQFYAEPTEEQSALLRQMGWTHHDIMWRTAFREPR